MIFRLTFNFDYANMIDKMYLRTTGRKNKDGTSIPYLQIAENVWNQAKKRSETRILLNLGRADAEQEERLRKLARSILRKCDDEYVGAKDITTLNSWAYGDLYTLECLWERLELKKELRQLLKEKDYEAPFERALFIMVANRCIAPYSKLYCYDQWLKEDIYFPEGNSIELHHFYRAMDFLESHKEEVEKAVFWKLADLFNLDVDIIFYDTTTVTFDIDEEDKESDDDSTPKTPGLRKRGRPSKKSTHSPKIVIGMAVTRDGFPVRSWVFPGNTVDVKTIAQVKNDLKGWRLGRCVFVGDRGMVSDENIRVLSCSGGRYILGMPLRRGDEVSEQVIGRPGKFATVKESPLFPQEPGESQADEKESEKKPLLKVKEVWLPHKDAGERARRYVICFNATEQKRQRAHREEVLRNLQAELASLEHARADHPKRACELLASRRYGKYLSQDSRGRLFIDKKKISREERLDGKFVVYSNDDTLTASDLALGYKQLIRVEQGWRDLKGGLKIGPVHHRHPFRIKAHVTLCVMALLLQRVAENSCGDSWRNIRDGLRQIKVTEYKSPDGHFVQANPIRPAPGAFLKAMKIAEPRLLLAVK